MSYIVRRRVYKNTDSSVSPWGRLSSPRIKFHHQHTWLLNIKPSVIPYHISVIPSVLLLLLLVYYAAINPKAYYSVTHINYSILILKQIEIEEYYLQTSLWLFLSFSFFCSTLTSFFPFPEEYECLCLNPVWRAFTFWITILMSHEMVVTAQFPKHLLGELLPLLHWLS